VRVNSASRDEGNLPTAWSKLLASFPKRGGPANGVRSAASTASGQLGRHVVAGLLAGRHARGSPPLVALTGPQTVGVIEVLARLGASGALAGRHMGALREFHRRSTFGCRRPPCPS